MSQRFSVAGKRILITGASSGFGAHFAMALAEEGADLVLAADLGCLLNIAGKLTRMGSRVRVRHVAEILAGTADGAAIGEPPGG